jgi:hypothetical protein
MPTYVLVHGCFHDGSSRARVIERLEWHGVRAFGPTVAGTDLGSRRTSPMQNRPDR